MFAFSSIFRAQRSSIVHLFWPQTSNLKRRVGAWLEERRPKRSSNGRRPSIELNFQNISHHIRENPVLKPVGQSYQSVKTGTVPDPDSIQVERSELLRYFF